MSNSSTTSDGRQARDEQRAAPHPDFDGHLERPFERMTAAERLAWLDEVIRLRASTTIVARPGPLPIDAADLNSVQ